VRIVIDYRPALRERTGVGHYVHELASAMAARLDPGESLILFSSSWKDRLSAALLPGTTTVDARVPVAVLNAAWHRLEWPPIERFAGPIDIAHSSHPLLMPARDAVRAVSIYDLDFLDHPDRTRAEIRRDYPALVRRHAQRADVVVVISEHTGRQVESRLGVAPERIVICRPGAPDWTPREEPGAAGPVLFVGTIEPRKNLPVLFAAYDRVLAARPDAPPLVLAGRTVEQSPEILDTLRAYPRLRDRVRPLGYVSNEARERLYREASLLVLPSLEEGFGMTVVEAMRVGLPVVASRAGALPEVLGDAGSLVDATDDLGLAAAIERLLSDPAARRRSAEAGRARAARFSWADSAARLLEAYRDLMARRKGRSPS
jgi:glycosyltransferase involved in cell wall biosynthesis